MSAGGEGYETSGEPDWPREDRPKGLRRPGLRSVSWRVAQHLGRGGADDRCVNHRWRWFAGDAQWMADFIDYLLGELRKNKHWRTCSEEEADRITSRVRGLLMQPGHVDLRKAADEKLQIGEPFCLSWCVHLYPHFRPTHQRTSSPPGHNAASAF